jgi:1-deoxy-D-xylulose 5-phosphate reductoisomerase
MIKKKICILGSTGSIGRSTLEIISKNKKDFDVVLLSGNSNIKLLILQAKKFKPKYIYSNNFYLTQKIKFFCIRIIFNRIIINYYILRLWGSCCMYKICFKSIFIDFV